MIIQTWLCWITGCRQAYPLECFGWPSKCNNLSLIQRGVLSIGLSTEHICIFSGVLIAMRLASVISQKMSRPTKYFLVTLYLLLTHTNCSYWSIASTSWRNHWPDRLSQSDSMVLSLVWQFIPFGCMVVSSSFCVWKKKSVVSAPIYRPVRLTFFTLYFVVQIHISQTFTPFFQNKNFQSLTFSSFGMMTDSD